MMKTERLGTGERFTAFTTGGFGKNITILEYNKLQYLEYTKSPLTHWTGLYDGMVHILSKSSVIRSPMMTEEEIEYMKRKCMEL